MNKIFFASLLIFNLTTVYALDDTKLQQAIAGKHRSAEHKNRDQYRHPLETLNFFEVEPTMSVVEIWPGGKGWYTEILAPYLKDQGALYTAQFSADSGIPYFTKSLEKFKQKTLAQPEIYSKITITTLYPPQLVDIAPENSVDRVLTFRNVHNWMKSREAENVFKAMLRALKPGGILGVVEHRAPAEREQDLKAISGYVTEDFVIALAEKAGLKFVAKSEVNANPKDTAEHPNGVWTLLPTLRLNDQDREKYMAIGESDRMTLKFIKPYRKHGN